LDDQTPREQAPTRVIGEGTRNRDSGMMMEEVQREMKWEGMKVTIVEGIQGIQIL
jgi:hypothetical protein